MTGSSIKASSKSLKSVTRGQSSGLVKERRLYVKQIDIVSRVSTDFAYVVLRCYL